MPPRGLLKPALPDGLLPATEKMALEIALANHPTLKSAQADVEAQTPSVQQP